MVVFSVIHQVIFMTLLLIMSTTHLNNCIARMRGLDLAIDGLRLHKDEATNSAPLTTIQFHNCIARIKWLDIEKDRLWLRKDNSINGAALPRPSLLLINYVEPEHLKKPW